MSPEDLDNLIQDARGHLPAALLAALAEEMRLPMSEVYEVATFYAHFHVVAEDETPPPPITVRVCDSVVCEMKGALDLFDALNEQAPDGVRVVKVPCIGRCDTAPAVEVPTRHTC